MSSSSENLDNFRIPLDEIKWATERFIPINCRAYCGYEEFYTFENYYGTNWLAFKRYTDHSFGQRLEYLEVRKKFLNEVKIVTMLNHENINVGFRGYCDEANEMIIVYEWHGNDNLIRLLKFPQERNNLKWAGRLRISIDVANGLNYLHTGLREHGTVIQNRVMVSNISLDENMKAQINDFEMSVLIPEDQPRRQVYKPEICAENGMDPHYLKTGILTVESDIYSFGVLLFKMLTREMGENEEQELTLVQHCNKHGVDKLIDPVIRYQIGTRSFHIIRDLAYKCTSYNIKGRPSMDTIIKTIQEALNIHKQKEVFTKEISKYRNSRNFKKPFEEKRLATENLRREYLLEDRRKENSDYRCQIYAGILSENGKNLRVLIYYFNPESVEYLNHLYIVSKFHHENILPYIGSSNQLDYKIMVFDYPKNGTLLDHLHTPKLLRPITWEQRLKICLGAARGLRCLHSGLWEESRVVHRAFRSEIIFLDDNLEARIGEFDSAISISRNQPQVYDAIKPTIGNEDYMDPIYEESKAVNVEVDVYSFGVVMFEILSGLTVCPRKTYDYGEDVEVDIVGVGADADGDHGEICNLMQRVYRHYYDELEKLIDPSIRDQIDVQSLSIYTETAYRCLSFNIKERPSMNRIIKRMEEALYVQKHGTTDSTITSQSLHNKNLEDFLIPLKEINLATRDFNETSVGGFCVVYKGQLSERWQNQEVAIKRLNKTAHQGKNEFLNELKLIFKFNHPNIIPFIGYCDEGNEMILVSEYASNGSLDNHLENPDKIGLLTWNKRLKICLGAAKGLDYLHTGLGEDNRVIHRDVKSGNILLDENMEAKICDFGLSKSDSAKQKQTKLYTNTAGTNCYTDPIYREGGILRPESDVYSFGVVMFEMLSGMPAYYRRPIGDDKPRLLINLVRRYYDYGKELLVDPKIRNQIDNSSFQIFIETAYQCISFNSKERPTMETIADKIEEALDFQVKEDDAQAMVIAMTEGPTPAPLVTSVLG